MKSHDQSGGTPAGAPRPVRARLDRRAAIGLMASCLAGCGGRGDRDKFKDLDRPKPAGDPSK